MLAPPLPGSVRLVPLGGLGEVGMNCLAVEQGEDVLVVDCGIRFPHDDLGVDVVHPDFTWLLERAERIRGIFLTHGHEDHIGALPYLLGDVDAPVFGPAHTLGMVRRRLAEHAFRDDELDLRLAVPGQEYSVGSFSVEPIRVSHSIVEASALRLKTDAGTIVHTGDFNFDPEPPDGEPTDVARLAEVATEGVALLLSDSTNIDVPQRSGTERSVGRAIESLVRQAEGRVFVALFASNIQRLMLLGEIAKATNRKICVLGRSLQVQTQIATEIGRLHWPSDLRVGPEEAKAMPRERVLVLAGGTQGEQNSAMSRLAAGIHPDLAIDPGDTVLFSSRIIPGNDLPVLRMMSDLLRRDARVHTRVTDPGIHTSGHASREEQTRMIDLVQPACFLPIHGTRHHLARHAALARELGVSSVAVAENGAALRCDGGSLGVEGSVPSGSIPVGYGGIELGAEVLRDRAELGRAGFASVAIVLDRKGEIVGVPSVATRGVAGMDDAAATRALQGDVVRALDAVRRRRLRGEELREEVRRAVRRNVFRAGGAKAMVEVHVLDERE